MASVTDDLELHPFRIPMRTRFRRVEHRDGVLVRGPAGWGEFSPFPDYGPEETGRWVRCAVEAATVPWPAPVRREVAVNVTVPAVGPQEAYRIVSSSGCTTAKVKVAEPGQAPEEDVARVEAVRDALGPAGRLRVDANGAWDVDTAAARIAELGRFDLEYVEQPVPSLEDMRELRRRVDVALAADESVRTAEDPRRIAGLDSADIVVLKVQPLGGLRRAVETADAAGLPVVVSSALETSVGLAAGLAFAASLPDLPYACGLATARLLDGDVVAEPLLPVEGAIPVRRPEPEPELLRRWSPEGPERRRLIERYRRAIEAASPLPTEAGDT